MNLNNDIWEDPEQFNPITAAALVDCMTFSVKEMLRRAAIAEEENGGPLEEKNNAYLYGCFCGLLIAGDTAEEMVKETPPEELPESVKSVLADYEDIVAFLTAPGMPWEEEGKRRKKAAEHLTARREGREEDWEDLEEDLEDQLEDLLADGDRKDAERAEGPVYSVSVKEILENVDPEDPEALKEYLQKKAEEQVAEETAEPVRPFHATPEQWEIINNVAEKRTPEALAAFLQLLADTLNGEEEGSPP